jgi:hypothetical protein
MCFPMDVSGDGSVIVGAPFTVGNNGVIWAPWSPPRDVGVLLQSLGVNLTGWNEVTAEAVADDGRTIGGTAVSGSIHRAWVARLPHGFGCYVNCDQSTLPPAINVLDFVCFLGRFTAGDSSANCDSSTNPPVLNVADFVCFLNRYAVGCP